jgi:uncharacterized membrane protein (UPF0127 family)
MRILLIIAASALLAGCGSKPASMEDLGTRDVVLPGGQTIRVETMIDTKDLLRGLMFRTSLPPDRGMLFIHMRPGNYPYWMYQTYIPLDMIWMDATKQIVEIVPSAPPCKTNASKCPHFGGNYMAQYVLQLGGGMAQKYGLHLGDRVSF